MKTIPPFRGFAKNPGSFEIHPVEGYNFLPLGDCARNRGVE
jgi:hypothetical protein